MSHSLTWNGTALSTYGLIVRLATPAPTLARTYDSMQCQDRAWAGKGQGAASVFNLPVIIVGTSSSNLLSRVSTVRGLLDQEDECTLAFDMYTDRSWLAKFDSMNGDYTSPTTWEGTIIFTCHDRTAYATAASTQTETLTENKSADYGGTVFAIAYDADGDYVYIAGGTTFTVQKLSSIDLSLVDESASYGGIIYALCAPAGDYVYCAGATTLKVQQLLKSDLTVNAESPSYGAGTVIYTISDYGNYIYYGGDGGAGQYDICKLLKSDMTTIVRSADLGGIIYCSATNSTHVFVGHADGAGHDHVGRYLITDLSFVDESDDYGDVIRAVCLNSTTCFWCGDLDEVWYAAVGDLTTETQSGDLGSDLNNICVDDDYIYVAGDDNVVYKLDIAFAASASYVAQSADYGGDLYGLAIDTVNQWLYIGGATTQTVWKLDSRHLFSVVALTLTAANYEATLAVDDTYIYTAAIASPYKVRKYRKSDLVKIAESADYGGIIYSMAIDEDGGYVYIGGATTVMVYKLTIESLVKVAESPSYVGSINSIIAPTGDYIYYGGGADGAGHYHVKKLLKSDMTTIVESNDAAAIIRSIDTDGTSIFYNCLNGGVYKLRKTDIATMAVDANSADYGGIIYAVCVGSAGTNIYIGGATTQAVREILIATMATVQTSADLGATIQWIGISQDSIFTGCGGTGWVKKLETTALTVTAIVSYTNIRGMTMDDADIYISVDYTNIYKLDNSNIGPRSDHEITITSAGTASCGLDFASTASQANYNQQSYANQTSGETFLWDGTQASGEELEVDSELQYCTLEGASAMSGASGEFLTLSPGANTLYLENVTGSVKFDWTDRFA